MERLSRVVALAKAWRESTTAKVLPRGCQRVIAQRRGLARNLRGPCKHIFKASGATAL